MNHDNVVDINQEPSTPSETKPFSLKDAKTRAVFDKVREEDVTEYQIPINWIFKDEKSQTRVISENNTHVIRVSDSMHTRGQFIGICVEEKKGVYYVRWGNHRWKAAKRLQELGKSIDNCDPGYMWVSMYADDPSKLPRLQARENAIHRESLSPTNDDSVRAMKVMINNGDLDTPEKKFVDCDDHEKKKRFRQEVKDTFEGAAFPKFWSTYYNSVKEDFQVLSTTTDEKLDYFYKNNPFGVKGKSELIKADGYVFKVNRDFDGNLCEEHYIYIAISANGVKFGNSYVSCWNGKYVNPIKCRYAYIITAVRSPTAKGLVITRERDSEKPLTQNNSVIGSQKFVDGVFYLPQTWEELRGTEKWGLSKKY